MMEHSEAGGAWVVPGVLYAVRTAPPSLDAGKGNLEYEMRPFQGSSGRRLRRSMSKQGAPFRIRRETVTSTLKVIVLLGTYPGRDIDRGLRRSDPITGPYPAPAINAHALPAQALHSITFLPPLLGF